MAKGNFPRGGGGNMNALMKQAQKLQQEMEKKKEEHNSKEFEATSGGGMVKVTVYGSNIMKSVEISPEVIDPDDIEMLQDLIIAATNEALRIADETEKQELGKLTGGLGLGF